MSSGTVQYLVVHGREGASIGDREVFSEVENQENMVSEKPRGEFQDGSSSHPCWEVALRLGSMQSSGDVDMINFSGVLGMEAHPKGLTGGGEGESQAAAIPSSFKKFCHEA